MFGLSLEKLMVIAIIAVIVVGPQRLPLYASRLAELIRAVRSFTETAKARAEEELGVPLTRAEWEALDPRRYDPRRIVREALQSDEDAAGAARPAGAVAAGAVAGAASAAGTEAVGAEAAVTAAADAEAVDAETAVVPDGGVEPTAAAPATPARPGRYVVTGSSGHPRRIFVPDEPLETESTVAVEPASTVEPASAVDPSPAAAPAAAATPIAVAR